MKTHDGPPCPFCGAPNGAATGVNTDERPSDGAVTICFSCVQPGIFTDNATAVRRPTDWELLALAADPGYRRVIAMLVARRGQQATS